MPDGTEYEAGVVEVGNDMQEVMFSSTFGSEVSVFSQIMSDEHNTPMVTRMQDINQNGFEVRMQAEETGSVPDTEMVGYLAIPNGNGDAW